MPEHLRIIGVSSSDRLDRCSEESDKPVIVRCHQRLRGPYTGVDALLREVLPDALTRCPELIDQHRTVLLYGMPDLADLVGPGPRAMADESTFKERTRFYGADMVRCMSQGIVTFLLAHAEQRRMAGMHPLTVVFEEMHAAEATTQEFVALLVRRADPAKLRVIVSGTADPLSAEYEKTLSEHSTRIVVPVGSREAGTGTDRSQLDLLTSYVDSDGTSDDPDEIAAYHRADREVVRRLHDRRADELELIADQGIRLGALPYHREHGSDPSQVGMRALLAAQQRCVEVGFSVTVADLGHRGRALTDPARDPESYCEFTLHAAMALVPLGRHDEAMEMYREVRRFPLPRYHMVTSYVIAMMYTRFLEPRDHDAALEWQNNARAIASILPDPHDRLIYGVFQDNALALIEMHRGNLLPALDLIDAGLARLNSQLADDEWRLHRAQLLYNRARLLIALGRTDEAYSDLSTLIELDPYYTDYLSGRAKISRAQGDLTAALSDYDRAVELGPPFPELYYNRGTARAELGDTAGALADFDYVLEMEPTDVDTRLSRCELLLGLGEITVAESDVETGLSLAPAEPRLLCMKGTMLLQRRMLPAALDSLNASLHADPRYPAALINRAVVHFEMDDPKGAIDDLTLTLDIVGDDADVLLNRGIAHHSAGLLDQALSDFDRALKLPDADTAELYYQRGRCLLDAGRSTDAAADLRESQRLDHHSEEIERLLATG